MRKLVCEVEVEKVVQGIKGYKPGYSPKILYVLINKETDTRFFEAQSSTLQRALSSIPTWLK